MDKDLIAAMNAWRLRQDPPLDPNEAILALLRMALDAEEAKSTPAPKQPVDPMDALVKAFAAQRHKG